MESHRVGHDWNDLAAAAAAAAACFIRIKKKWGYEASQLENIEFQWLIQRVNYILKFTSLINTNLS